MSATDSLPRCKYKKYLAKTIIFSHIFYKISVKNYFSNTFRRFFIFFRLLYTPRFRNDVYSTRTNYCCRTDAITTQNYMTRLKRLLTIKESLLISNTRLLLVLIGTCTLTGALEYAYERTGVRQLSTESDVGRLISRTS